MLVFLRTGSGALDATIWQAESESSDDTALYLWFGTGWYHAG